jgi:hypothetical protein
MHIVQRVVSAGGEGHERMKAHGDDSILKAASGDGSGIKDIKDVQKLGVAEVTFLEGSTGIRSNTLAN